MCRMMSGTQFVGSVAYYCVKNSIESLTISKISEIWNGVSSFFQKEDDIIYYSPCDVYAISSKHPTLFRVNKNIVEFSKDKEKKYHIYFYAGIPKELSKKLNVKIGECLNQKQ